LVAGTLMLIAFVPLTAAAQTAQPPAGITVAGYGEATAPAASVDVQILITRGENYGGPPARPKRGVEPGAEEREQAAPVVAALVAKGLAESAISVKVSPIFESAFYGPGGPAVARLDFSIDKPDMAKLTELVAAAGSAASDQDLSIGQVGARLHATDCPGLERQAREAAIEEARASANIQADLLGVKLGDVTASSDMPVSSIFGVNYAGVSVDPGGCAPPQQSALGIAGLSVSFPAFDSTEELEVEVYSQVMLTFAVSA
jgi:uncharacterized protein YggE